MRIEQKRLQKLYPEMTDAFALRMERMIRALPDQKEDTKVKRLALHTVLIWTLLAVLLCATAYAVISYGLEWYYNNRFTAYQEYEPEKHAAIMENLQSGLAQSAMGNELVDILVSEASWVEAERLLVVSLTAIARDTDAYELHPMWNLDADGAYIGEGGVENPASDGEDRATHWLWTKQGFGPVEEMVSPGKRLLLLDSERVLLNGVRLLGDGSSSDAYVGEDGAVHTVLEMRLDFMDEDFETRLHQRMQEHPDMTAYYEEQLSTGLELRRQILEDEDGVLILTVPFSVTPYTNDDTQLYQGGQPGEVSFELKIR